VRVWDVDPRATQPVLRGHTRYVNPVAYSPDGRWIASGGRDSKVHLWDAATGVPCATLPHPGIVRSLAYGPDGRSLVSGSDGESRLRIWDVATARVRKEIRVPAEDFRSLAVSPDGRRVAATACEERSKYHLHVCDIASGERLFSAEGGTLAYTSPPIGARRVSVRSTRLESGLSRGNDVRGGADAQPERSHPCLCIDKI
jgi:WD40 repeat protein